MKDLPLHNRLIYIRSIFIIPILFLCTLAQAQSLSVEKFQLLDNDLTANTRGTMKYDQNGDVAALIKIVTTETDFNFDVGSLGVVATSQQKGEIWVYVPGGVQRITITHSKLGVLRNYYFPIPVEKGRTYELKLISGAIRSIVEQTVTSQFVVFKVNPTNASIYIDEELRSLDDEGVLSIRLPIGNHNYMIMAPSYISEAGVVDVGTSKVTKEISLVSAKASLSVRTSSDAQIWINDKYMGIGTWNGNLEAGLYLIEARKESHRTTFEEVTLTQQESKSIFLPSPEGVFGSVEINGTPVECDYYINGQLKGKTPEILEKLLIGKYKIEFQKKGYIAKTYDVEVKENEMSSVSYSLEKQLVPYGSLQIKSKPSSASVLIDDKRVGVTPLVVDALEVGLHKIWISKDNYNTYYKQVTISENKTEKINTKLEPSLQKRKSRVSNYVNPNHYRDDELLSLSVGYDIGNMSGFFLGLGCSGGDWVFDSWYTIPGVPKSSNNGAVPEFSSLMLGMDLGRCINSGGIVQIVPKMGISFMMTSYPKGYSSYSLGLDDNSWIVNIGCRCQTSLGTGVGLYVVPEYRYCIDKNEILSLYNCDNSSVNGLYLKLGIELSIDLK